MAPRAIWKGHLRLSLVSIPVEIYAATKSTGRTTFRQIHKPTGKRVRHEKTVPGIGPVDSDEIVKGYDPGDGEHVLIEPQELDEIKLETKRTFELVQFVGAGEIPPLYFDRPYYVAVSDEMGEDAYRVIRDALRSSEKVGLGQLTMRGKEHLAAVKPCGEGLLLETLHYPDELRAAEPLFGEVRDEAPDDELLEVATSLIGRKTAPFEPAAYSDRYTAALQELIEAKTGDRDAPRAATEEAGPREGENVVDLMSALKDSLDRTEGGRKSSGKGGGSKGGGRKSTGGGKRSSGGKNRKTAS